MSKQIKFLIAGLVIGTFIITIYNFILTINKLNLVTNTISIQIINIEKNNIWNFIKNKFKINSDRYQLNLDTKKTNRFINIDFQNQLLTNLSSEVNSEYHKGKPFYSNAIDHGLISIEFAPKPIKKKIKNIDKELISKLLDTWKLSNSDQVMKEIEGWKQQGNVITYRTAWISNNYQCTWYVIQWNKYTQQLINEGYISCF